MNNDIFVLFIFIHLHIMCASMETNRFILDIVGQTALSFEWSSDA